MLRKAPWLLRPVRQPLPAPACERAAGSIWRQQVASPRTRPNQSGGADGVGTTQSQGARSLCTGESRNACSCVVCGSLVNVGWPVGGCTLLARVRCDCACTAFLTRPYARALHVIQCCVGHNGRKGATCRGPSRQAQAASGAAQAYGGACEGRQPVRARTCVSARVTRRPPHARAHAHSACGPPHVLHTATLPPTERKRLSLPQLLLRHRPHPHRHRHPRQPRRLRARASTSTLMTCWGLGLLGHQRMVVARLRLAVLTEPLSLLAAVLLLRRALLVPRRLPPTWRPQWPPRCNSALLPS